MARSPGNQPALAALAKQQGGVVTARQLRSLGFSSHTQRTRLASGEWVRRFNAIAVDGKPETDISIAWALQVSGGPASHVTGPVAARLGGVGVTLDLPLVVLPKEVHVRVADARVLRRVNPGPVRVRGGLRVAPPADALLDTLLTIGHTRAVDLLDVALQRRWLTPRSLSALLDARTRRGQVVGLPARRLEARAATGSRSAGEHLVRSCLLRSGTGDWVANFPLYDETGRIVAELDFALVSLRIAIEFDGRAYHSDRAAFERDRARQNALVLGGWLVLRFTWDRVVGDPDGVISEIQRAVRLRSCP